MPGDFDLDAVIRAAVEASRTPDPRAIASTVAAAIPADELRSVVALLLPDRVRMSFHSRRTSTQRASADPGADRGSRWADASAVYRRVLGICEQVNGEWKFFRDCSADDVLALAGQRTELAKANAEAANRYERVATAMRRAKATTVADLPEPALLEAWA